MTKEILSLIVEDLRWQLTFAYDNEMDWDNFIEVAQEAKQLREDLNESSR